MKKIYLYFAMLATVAAACTKDESDFSQDGNGAVPADTPEVKMITETISGRSGSSTITRATIADADGAFSWSADDHIAVHVSMDGNHEYVFTSEDGGAGATVDADDSSKATFTVAYQMGYTRDAFAIYPSTIVSKNAANYGQSGSTLDVTLPSSYTLDQVTTEKTPCPMISDNDPESDTWEFFQLCGLLRLTANSIPTDAKRLEINFGEKSVAGNFSIPNPAGDGSSTIAIEDASGSNSSIITITKDGSDTTLGGESLVLNIPLPTGTYTDFMVTAYDALTGGTSTRVGIESFAYTAVNTKAVKKATTLSKQSIFKFTFRNNNTVLENLRFVRGFSNLNKLHNGETTYGPFTESDSENNLPKTIQKTLEFDDNSGDLFVFQVVGADGKVYAGSIAAPEDGYVAGQVYDLMVDVNLYTFTVAAGKKVYFSPGDLGVDNGVYSFTEPFTTWGHTATKEDNNSLKKRVWFNYTEVDDASDPAVLLYGVTWRIETKESGAYEWDYILSTRTMNDGVNRYYKLTVNGNANCLLLPPDETQSTDIGEDMINGNVTDYAKYFAKGFVLLMNANRGSFNATKKTISWSSTYYSYWMVYQNNTNRKELIWSSTNNPEVDWPTAQFRMHVRLVHDVE